MKYYGGYGAMFNAIIMMCSSCSTCFYIYNHFLRRDFFILIIFVFCLSPERESADMSQFLDIHSMCGLVKLYFRMLPRPLITTDVFDKFISAAGKKEIYSVFKSI